MKVRYIAFECADLTVGGVYECLGQEHDGSLTIPARIIFIRCTSLKWLRNEETKKNKPHTYAA